MIDNDDIFGTEPMMHLDQLTHLLEYLKDGIECIEIGLKKVERQSTNYKIKQHNINYNSILFFLHILTTQFLISNFCIGNKHDAYHID